ncbi:MAG: Lrp/AsnC family transcriptional regulator [Thermoplasmatota archaeon]
MDNSKKTNKKVEDADIIKWLLEDPTRSLNEMAKSLNLYRQTLWRRKKKLEDDKVIWGYTAVVDENKLGNVIYLVLMKMKPMTRGLADIIYRRIKNEEMGRLNVRLIDAFHVNGDYDWVLRFSAPDHATARKYYDAIRVIYEDYLIEKPVIVDVNFIVKAEGMKNPDLENLYKFVPEI